MKKRALPQQVIRIGGHRMALPEGVTVLDWALERISYQNPRIRAFLGSIRLIQGVLESNYSLLHCSPERLHDIWRKVQKISLLIRTDIAPLLTAPSCIPRLEEARRGAELSLEMVDRHVLDDLDRSLQDLMTFVPIWLDNIEKRRALLLRRSAEEAGQSA